jgi:hypothetical protein
MCYSAGMTRMREQGLRKQLWLVSLLEPLCATEPVHAWLQG